MVASQRQRRPSTGGAKEGQSVGSKRHPRERVGMVFGVGEVWNGDRSGKIWGSGSTRRLLHLYGRESESFVSAFYESSYQATRCRLPLRYTKSRLASTTSVH